MERDGDSQNTTHEQKGDLLDLRSRLRGDQPHDQRPDGGGVSMASSEQPSRVSSPLSLCLSASQSVTHLTWATRTAAQGRDFPRRHTGAPSETTLPCTKVLSLSHLVEEKGRQTPLKMVT